MKEELSPIEIDLGAARRGKLDESFLSMFGGAIKMLYGRMFGDTSSIFPVNVRGTKAELSSFARLLNKEKDYIDAYKKFGLNDPVTYNNKYRLDGAVQRFEKTTGLKWPFK